MALNDDSLQKFFVNKFCPCQRNTIFDQSTVAHYVLFNKRAKVFLKDLKPEASSASGIRPDKICLASLINGFRNDAPYGSNHGIY